MKIPLQPNNPETRLLRAIFGICPDCDHFEKSHHDGNDYGQTHHCYECEVSQVKKNWLRESKKRELDRRVTALELHIQELEGRITRNAYLHAREFHKGQEGHILPPEEG